MTTFNAAALSLYIHREPAPFGGPAYFNSVSGDRCENRDEAPKSAHQTLHNLGLDPATTTLVEAQRRYEQSL